MRGKGAHVYTGSLLLGFRVTPYHEALQLFPFTITFLHGRARPTVKVLSKNSKQQQQQQQLVSEQKLH